MRDLSPSTAVLPLSLSFHNCYVLTFLLVLLPPEGHVCEVSVPPNRRKLFQISVILRQKRTLNLAPGLFWAVIQRWFVVDTRSFGTTHRSYFEGSRCFMEVLTLGTGNNCCTETSVRIYQPALHKIQEDRRSQPNPGLTIFLEFRLLLTRKLATRLFTVFFSTSVTSGRFAVCRV